MLMYMQYGPYICFGAILAVLFVLWAFWGGKKYDFVGLAPLDPETCGSYTGSLYNWGNITPGVGLDQVQNITHADSVTDNLNGQKCQMGIAVDNTPIIPEEFVVDHHIFRADNGHESLILEEREREVSDLQATHNSIVDDVPDDVVCRQDGLPVILDHIPESYKSRLRSVTRASLPQPNNPTNFVNQRGRFVSRGERMCCQTMTNIYGVPFTTIRPDWLQNPETGENLELDCYNDELRIAVEYNGEQHYKWPNWTAQTYEQFINQTRRDEYKMNACDRNGVYLIVVPFNIPYENIPAFITSHLPENIRKRIHDEDAFANIHQFSGSSR